MRFVLSFLLFVFFVVTVSTVFGYPSAPYGSRAQWVKKAEAPKTAMKSLTFMMPQKNVELFNDIFWSITDPKSPLYGKWLSGDELAKMTAVPESLEAVRSWLSKKGAANIQVPPSGDFITAELPISTVEREFATTLYSFTPNFQSTVYSSINRAETYTIPAELNGHIQFVTNLNNFPPAHRKPQIAKHRSAVERKLLQASGSVTPQLLWSYYNVRSQTVASKSAKQALFEDGQYFDQSDLSAYFQTYNIPNANLSKIIGTNIAGACANGDPNQQCVESMLDVEQIMATAQGAPTEFYLINTQDPQPFVDFLQDLVNDPNPPLVNSVSYGEQENQVPLNITTAFNHVIQKVGAKGISVLIASGDSGVTGADAQGNLQCFVADYPASSPFVTAVGATQGPESNQPEIGCSSLTGAIITSGGGFSNVWSTPSYQKAAVAAYLSQNSTGTMPPKNSGYNAAGRGYPDVALLGHTYNIYDGGQMIQADGTSCSTPVFASFLTLINGARLAAGKTSVGFVNPALYQFAQSNPKVFHDITSGINSCGVNQGFGATCCTYGFPAVKGWDAMTGLGSVDFENLKAAFMSLQ